MSKSTKETSRTGDFSGDRQMDRQLELASTPVFCAKQFYHVSSPGAHFFMLTKQNFVVGEFVLGNMKYKCALPGPPVNPHFIKNFILPCLL